MDNRDLLTTIAVAAVVLAAVLAAGYILVTALTSSAGPTPTPAPTAASSPTPTPYSTIPSGPFNPSGTPSNATYPVVPTPVRPVIKKTELVGWGTDKDSYNRGDTAITYITIKNTGTVPVDEARLDILVERYVPVIGYVNVQSPTTTLTGLNIQPGETQKAKYTIEIPNDYEGISTAGKYRFTVDVYVWDTEIGDDLKKEVVVT